MDPREKAETPPSPPEYKELFAKAKLGESTMIGGLSCFLREDNWLFNLSKEFAANEEAFTYIGGKLHFNLNDPKEIADAWHALAPFRCKYEKYIANAKILNFPGMEKTCEKTYHALFNDPAYLKRYPIQYFYDPDRGKIYAQENSDLIKLHNEFKESEHRYRHSSQILFYLYFPKEMSLDECKAIYLEIAQEADKALQQSKSKLTPGRTPLSDFPVKGCQFTSVRIDTDKDGKYVDGLLEPHRKFEFVDEPLIKTLVDPAHFDEKKFDAKSVEPAPGVLPNPKPEEIVDVIAEIRKVVNKDTLTTLWKKECAGMEALYKQIEGISTVVSLENDSDGIDRNLALLYALIAIDEIIRNIPNNSLFNPVSMKVELLCEGMHELLAGNMIGMDSIITLQLEVEKLAFVNSNLPRASRNY